MITLDFNLREKATIKPEIILYIFLMLPYEEIKGAYWIIQRFLIYPILR